MLEASETRSSGPVTLSIVIPTYRRVERLRTLLHAIINQEDPGVRFEVLVVDDGGGGVEEAVLELSESLPLTVFSQPNSGPARARNLGARHAQGRRLVFIDDDCVPKRDWLKQIATAHSKAPLAALGGTTKNLLPRNLFSSASQTMIDFLYLYFQREEGRNDSFLTTNNASVPLAGFNQIGGFDEGFSLAAGEDREFFDRWRYYGGNLIFCPKIVVGHAHRLNQMSFLRQHFYYGFAARRFWLAKWAREGRRRRTKTRFYRELVLYPILDQGTSVRAVVLSVLVLLSQVANLLGYGWARIEETRKKRCL